MATVASFNVALVASTGRFVAAMSQAERNWNSFVRSVQRGAKQMPKAIQEATSASLTLARQVAKVAAAGAAAASVLATLGVREYARWEQARTALSKFTGSLESADRLLRSFDERAVRGPIDPALLQEGAQMLLAWRFSLEEVERMLDPISEAVTAMGGGVDQLRSIIKALGQMRAYNRVAAEEMNQLADAGVSGWRYLADELGVSIAEAMERSRKGLISAQTAIDAILKGMARDFGGTIAAQANTLTGQWTMLRSRLALIARGIGRDLVQGLGLPRLMNQLNQALGSFAAAAAQQGVVGALRTAFPPWLQSVIVGIAGAIVGGLVPAIVAFLVPALRKLRAAIAATGLSLRVWMVGGAAVALALYALARAFGGLGNAAQAAWALISAVVQYGASVVVRAIGAILQVVSILVPGLRGVAQAVLGVAAQLRASAGQSLAAARAAAKSAQSTQAVGQSAQRTAQAAQQAAEAQEGLGEATEKAAKAAADNLQSFDEVHQIQEAMADSPAAMEMPALDMAMPEVPAGGLGGALGELAQQVEETTGRLAQAWQTAVERISALWDGLKAKALATFPWLTDVAGWFARAGQWLRDNWDTVGPVFWTVVDAVAAVGLAFLAVTNPIGAVVAGALALTGVAAVLIDNWDAVGPALVGIWEAIAPTVIRIWEALRDAAITVWNALVTATKAIWSALRAWWSVWGDNVLAILGAVWRQIALTVETALRLIQHVVGFVLAVIRGDWDTAWQHVQGIAVTIWNFLVGTAQNLWTVLQAVWSGIVEGLQLAWQWVQTITVAVWTALTQWLTMVWQGLLMTATTVWQAIQTTIAAWWEAIRSGTEAVWTALSQWLGNLWAGIAATVAATWEAITTTVGTWWEAVRAGTEAIWTTLTQWLGTTWANIQATAAAAWQAMRDAIAGLVEATRARIEASWTAIAASLERIWNGIRDTASKVWNGLVDLIRGAINNVIAKINRFLDALSNIQIRVPEVNIPLVGKVGGFSIGLPPIPKIPMLARGGDIVGSGLALVGEAGPELLHLPRGARVTPLSGGGDLNDTIYRAVFEAVLDAMRTAQAAAPAGGDREIVLQIDGRTFARAQLPHLIAEGQRQGWQLVLRPAQGV